MMHVILISLSRGLAAVFGRHDCEGNVRSPVCPAGPSVSEWRNSESQRLILSHCLSALGHSEKLQEREKNLIRVGCARHYLSFVGV